MLKRSECWCATAVRTGAVEGEREDVGVGHRESLVNRWTTSSVHLSSR